MQSLGIELFGANINGPNSQNYIAANVGLFIPFVIPEATTFTKMFWCNGSAVTGNIDVGLFQEDGTLIVSIGSTAQSGTTNAQAVDITDTTLARGRYYLGMTSDTSSISQKVYASLPPAGVLQAFGLVEDASCAPPLSTNANPATFVAYTRAFIPLFGAQGYRTLGP